MRCVWMSLEGIISYPWEALVCVHVHELILVLYAGYSREQRGYDWSPRTCDDKVVLLAWAIKSALNYKKPSGIIDIQWVAAPATEMK